MGSPAVAAGRAAGFQAGLSGARERRRREEREDFELAQAQAEADYLSQVRPKSLAAMDAEAEAQGISLEQLRAQQPYFDQNAGNAAARGELALEADQFSLNSARELQPIQTEGARLGNEAARFELDSAREMRPIQTEGARLGNESAQQSVSDAQNRSAREQDDHERTLAMMEEEGLTRLFADLDAGVAPDLAMRKFNAIGSKRLTNVAYDPQTGMVSLEDDEGESAPPRPLSEWRQAYPTQQSPDELIKLGENDRLVDPNTYQEVVGPSGGGSGRDESPYNPQSVQDDITAGIVRSMGGQFDTYGNYSFGDSSDRAIGDYRIAVAQDIAGEFENFLKESETSPGRVVSIVMEASRDLDTDTELREQFTKDMGRNADPADIDRAVEAERMAQRAKAEATARSKMRSMVARSGPPDWSTGDPIQIQDPSQFEFGYEYDVNIDGRETTVRLGADGQVYEVDGGERAIQDRANAERQAEQSAVNQSLQDARRGNTGIVY